MTLLLKDPQATLDYAVDWGAEYLSLDAIATSVWDVSPVEAGGVTIVGSDADLAIATVKVSGGVPGHRYRLHNQVELVSGRIDSRSIVLRVEQR
ncbi:MAG: hypothetical protein ABIP91_03590 [Sphingomicrobium sp.]